MTTSQIPSRTVPLTPDRAAGGGRRFVSLRLVVGVAAILGVLVVGALGWKWSRTLGDSAGGGRGLLSYTVEPIDLRLTVLESATLESASSINVLSQVEGRVAIISLAPDGTRVEAGDVVIELDSAALKTRRREQQIVVEKARAAESQAEQAHVVAISQAESDVTRASLDLEFAKLDREKYIEGDYPQLVRLVQGEITLAEQELNRFRAQLNYSTELRRDGYISEEELRVDQSRLKKAEIELEAANEKKRVLQQYSHPRMMRDLDTKIEEANRALERVKKLADAAVEQARTNLQAQRATLQLEEAKLEHVSRQIENCTMRAPQAGVVVYPIPEDDDLVELFIKEGTIVRERQHVYSIPDTDLLQATTSIHEAMVNRVRPGMPAKIWIDVYPDLVLSGSVGYVSPMPDPEDWRRETVKFYTTAVTIDQHDPRLRPGMSAKVEILIGERTDVLAVPVQAVVQRGDYGACYALVGGRTELRRLELGKANAQHVEVKSGLAAGERVVLSPDVIGVPVGLLQELEEQRIEPVLAAPTPASEPAEEPVKQEVEYKAVLLGNTPALAEIELEFTTIGDFSKTEIDLEVRDGPPGAVWALIFDGLLIGEITLDETGAAMMEWSSKDGSLPADFPANAGSGSTVSLGDVLSGTLQR